MRRVLGALAILIAAVAVGLGVGVVLHHRSSGSGSGSSGGGATGSTTTLAPEIVPAPGQTLLTGTVTTLTATNAVGPALTPPFTLTIPVRGAGSADITGAQVGGSNVEIYWYGGQPLPFSGTGQLAINGGAVSINASGTTWMLDGATRSLTPGHFFLGSPVAVGTSGLATPEQSLAFDTGSDATMITSGGAQIHQAPAALSLTGPGSVNLQGTFQMQTDTATRSVHTVVFGPGSFDIALTPIAEGDTIKATLQGAISFG
jgi:hypothetical protein